MISAGTEVTYPAGATSSRGIVVDVVPGPGGRTAVVLDATAFHPVDTAWPDQPADRGTLRAGDATYAIADAVVGARADGDLLLGPDVPVRTGTDGWIFVVAHLIDGDGPEVGDSVEVDVDPDHRAALSAGHTACHLASLALDAALAGAWTKPAQTDALGAPGFDALAIQESRIVPNGSVDTYRIGRSLRRKGFDPTALGDLDDLRARIEALLAEWVSAGGAVRIETAGPALADRRTWVCALPEAEARIPCGGTHVASLAELGAVTVSFEKREVEGGLELVMTTVAERV